MRILSYGLLSIDYTYSVDHFVRGGEALSSDSMSVSSGGKGLNQSITLGRSGAEVWYADAVRTGDGNFLIRQFRSADVNTEPITILESKTGHVIIQKTKDGGSCILLYGGADQEITRSMVDGVVECFEAGDYLVLQDEISEIDHTMEKTHEKQMKIVSNPSPMDRRIGEHPLEYVDYLPLNEIEAENIRSEQGEGEVPLRKLPAEFPGARIVPTLGGDGSLYWGGERLSKRGICKVEVADTATVGGTFTGLFIGDLVQSMDAVAALRWTTKAAVIAVSRQGATPSIPSRDEVNGS